MNHITELLSLQVTGIDGNYRMTCQKVMAVLRDNKESLMAVLEAFVYDPLLSWRLLDAHKVKGGNPPTKGAKSGSMNDSHDAAGNWKIYNSSS